MGKEEGKVSRHHGERGEPFSCDGDTEREESCSKGISESSLMEPATPAATH